MVGFKEMPSWCNRGLFLKYSTFLDSKNNRKKNKRIACRDELGSGVSLHLFIPLTFYSWAKQLLGTDARVFKCRFVLACRCVTAWFFFSSLFGVESCSNRQPVYGGSRQQLASRLRCVKITSHPETIRTRHTLMWRSRSRAALLTGPWESGWFVGKKGLSSCLHLPSVQGGGCDGATSDARTHTCTCTHRGETEGCILTDAGPVRETNSWKAGNNVGYITNKAHTIVGQVRPFLSAWRARALFCALTYTCTAMKTNNMFTNGGKEREKYFWQRGVNNSAEIAGLWVKKDSRHASL